MRLEARGLDFGYRGRVIGRGVSFGLHDAEVVCLLGPNGGGKTTLLRTLLGLLAPLGGSVALEDRPLDGWSAAERAARLAYVPQASESYFDFSVAEMVEMGRTAHRGVFAAPREQDRQIARECIERLGITHLAERPIHRVSGGERQLALIARALATGATCLVMDEPTANLDFGNQSLILAEIARLRAAGATVLFSTHHPDHALQVADRVVLLRAGGVLAAGATADVVDSARLSALYGVPVEVAELTLPDGRRRRTCLSARE